MISTSDSGFLVQGTTATSLLFVLSSSSPIFPQKILSLVCMSSFGVSVSVSDVNEIFGRWVNQGTLRRRPGVGRLAATLAPT